ncbi:MAG TPA: hypothetical protein VNJ52_05155 [Patescibacteria group bacterium]|nr:hypothetical protein [Patescibacteria group bacterium]
MDIETELLGNEIEHDWSTREEKASDMIEDILGVAALVTFFYLLFVVVPSYFPHFLR